MHIQYKILYILSIVTNLEGLNASH